MLNRFITLNGKKFNSIVDFIYAMQANGFDSEFYNSLVMKAFWSSAENLRTVVGKDDNLVLETEVVEDEHHGELLKLHVNALGYDHRETITLFLRGDDVAVLSDVIKDRVVTQEYPDSSVVTIKEGERITWDETLEVFTQHPRFNELSIKVFSLVYKAVRPKTLTDLDYVRMTTREDGIAVVYVVNGKVVQRLTYGFNR